jgi:hypothetical protein
MLSFLSVSAAAAGYVTTNEGKQIYICDFPTETPECFVRWIQYSLSSKARLNVAPQEREIGRLTGLGSGDYACPATYNGLQVDRCSGFRYRVGFELWRYSWFQGYTFSRSECQTLKTHGYQDSNTCREAISGTGQPGQYGTDMNSLFPLGFGPGETASFSTGSGDITYFESFIQCADGSYAYRSLCPKPITCADGSVVYIQNNCPKPACVPNWQASAWGECLSNSLQTRTAIDLNNCGTDSNKPALSQGCIYGSPPVSGGGTTPPPAGGPAVPECPIEWFDMQTGICKATNIAPDFFADPLGWIIFQWNGFWKSVFN